MDDGKNDGTKNDAYAADGAPTTGAAQRSNGTPTTPGTPGTPQVPEQLELSAEDVKPAMEAILMATDQPLHSADFARVLDCPVTEADRLLTELADEYDAQHRGFELRRTARGWQFASRAEFEGVVSRFVTDGQTARLSQAALEALAIIAYKQPVTRAQVAAIRGVNSDGVIRSLSVRGLIREAGTDPESKATLLATSGLFLDYMGIESLAQLPPLAPFLPAQSAANSDEAFGMDS